MIRVLIEMEEQTSQINIGCDAPTPIAFAVITAAYHTMFARVIREQMAAEQRIIPVDGSALKRLPPEPRNFG